MIIKYRKAFLAIIDGFIIYISYFLAMLLRFSNTFSVRFQVKFLGNLESVIWYYVLIGVVILFFIGFYRRLPTQPIIVEQVSIVIAVTISSCLHFIIPYFFISFQGYFLPRSVLIIAYFLQIVLISGTRLIWKIMTDKELQKRVVKNLFRNILFSPPDISNIEIEEVVKVMKSGWITTGPRTKEFERRIAEYVGVKKAACLNSNTASMELTLRILGVGPGDEVITSPYTYTASASVIHHVGAKIILVDTAPDSYEMDYNKLAEAITERTKVIIPVDLAGKMCDYDEIYKAIERKKNIYRPNNEIQGIFDRCIVLADAAHSFGARSKGKKCGQVADFTCFSFHAVKNLTTAEGGAVVWRNDRGLNDDWLYKQYMLYSLHGQSKDALDKSKKGEWEYDIIYPAYKCNMTDILAGFGLMQLNRYADLLNRRREINDRYDKALIPLGIMRLKHFDNDYASTAHLYLVRIPGIDEITRNEIITKMAKLGISTNVHYKPLPMHTAYKNLGFDIKDYPNAFNMYKNEITLPLHTLLKDEDVDYICENFKRILQPMIGSKENAIELEEMNV